MQVAGRLAQRQSGAAALIVAVLLFGALTLTALYVHRNLWLEQRSALNQYRSTQAFEAAEAGLEWALARLNDRRRVGADCVPVDDPAAASFRARYLRAGVADAVFVPVVRSEAGVATALRPGCARRGDAWSCSCPADGSDAPAEASGSAAAGAAFTLRFAATGLPGLVRIEATGCANPAGACVPGGAPDPADATATLQVTVGLIGGLRSPPAATLTLRGAFDAGTAPIGVHNADPASGVAIRAGTTISASRARLTVPAGAPLSGALAGADAALAATTADRLFASHFGLDKATWQRQPMVARVACGGDCGAAIAAAVDAGDTPALIWVDGDLTLTGPLVLGSPERPVLLVASGAMRLDGAVALHGVVYAAALRWDRAGGGAWLRGAALSESDYRGDGAPDLVRDRAVLATLSGRSGSFARVNGSWRDF